MIYEFSKFIDYNEMFTEYVDTVYKKTMKTGGTMIKFMETTYYVWFILAIGTAMYSSLYSSLIVIIMIFGSFINKDTPKKYLIDAVLSFVLFGAFFIIELIRMVKIMF